MNENHPHGSTTIFLAPGNWFGPGGAMVKGCGSTALCMEPVYVVIGFNLLFCSCKRFPGFLTYQEGSFDPNLHQHQSLHRRCLNGVFGGSPVGSAIVSRTGNTTTSPPSNQSNISHVREVSLVRLVRTLIAFKQINQQEVGGHILGDAMECHYFSMVPGLCRQGFVVRLPTAERLAGAGLDRQGVVDSRILGT